MPENTMTNQEKLSGLRAALKKQGLDGVILPRTDEFQGEYLAPYAERLAWLTGFTGSAGFAVILQDKAVVMSDGRYSIQLKQQVDASLYETGNSTETSAGEWIEAKGGGHIGYDPWLHTPKQLEAIKKHLKKTELVPLTANPIDALWTNRPQPPQESAYLFSDIVAGRTSVQKRKDIDILLKEKGADALILTQADAICWLLNVRGNDVPYSPLVLSYAVLHQDGILDWFVDPVKIPLTVEKHLAGVTLHKPDTLAATLKKFKGQSVCIDGASAPLWFFETLRQSGANILDEKNPCNAIKAIKTPSEQAAIRDAHIRDGAAIVRFMAWLAQESPKGILTEISVAEQLDTFRRADPDYRDESFAAIAGFAGNGAIIHYRAAPETNADIKGDNLLLLDSGAQYESGGTTDITRTFAIGKPTPEMKDRYTRVLKGHIALSRATFPAGSTGAQVDTFARQPLWEISLDYAHGTGHGVGCFLGVHEEAATISPRGDKPLQPGMLLSNEPGYYKEGHYGIRIENLVLVVEKGFCADTKKSLLGFETVTLAPYDHRLIDFALLDSADREWLGAYYKKISDALSPLLGKPEKKWLDHELSKIV